MKTIDEEWLGSVGVTTQ